MQKTTDFIQEFLIAKGIKCQFGYPGGVICHYLDSARKYQNEIDTVLNYHEQASAFSACGYAHAVQIPGVCFATSGPGTTNLLTGVANAFYDSIPMIVFTGQVDTYSLRQDERQRQRGFQEVDTVSLFKPITKYAVQIKNVNDMRYELEKAFWLATNGRKGPVLLDLPADVQRAYADFDHMQKYTSDGLLSSSASQLISALEQAKRPLIVAGAGVRQSGMAALFRELVEKWRIPVVTSMPALDLLEYAHPLYGGFIGTNGHRYANMLVAKSDVILTLGSRLDLKQVGSERNKFAPQAKIYRVDIDESELAQKVQDSETDIKADIETLLPELLHHTPKMDYRDGNWLAVVRLVKKKLQYCNDTEKAHRYVREISRLAPEETSYVLDVGQHQVWTAQALEIKRNQRVYMSAGLGSMGYALPAAIGVYYATRKPVCVFVGDGGLQMNIQELNLIARENMPISVFVFNNKSLGMIRQFQEKNFNSYFFKTTQNTGYHPLSLHKLADAYGMKYDAVKDTKELSPLASRVQEPAIIELDLPSNTYLTPNYAKGQPLYNQMPELNSADIEELLAL